MTTETSRSPTDGVGNDPYLGTLRGLHQPIDEASDHSAETVPPLSGVDLAIAEAAHYSDLGHTLAAEQAYARADHLLGSERSPRHVEVLVCLAILLRKRGDLVQAASHLDMALAIFPGHRAALSLRLGLAEEQKEPATAAALRIKLADLCESAEARVHVLSAVIDDALSAAVSAALKAVELRPTDDELRQRLGALLAVT